MWNPALVLLAGEENYLEYRVGRQERVAEKRRMRDSHDPFEMDDNAFIDLYRLRPDSVMNLVEELRPHLERPRPYGISVEHQVLAALRFYAKGCHQDAVGEQYDLGLSPPSISRCIRDVTEWMNRRLLYRWVRFPMTPDERYAAKQKFVNAREPFPGTLGAIDCTYVNMIAPSVNEEAFVNHHGNHAMNVQMICDPDLKVLNVNARYPGARNDYFIWQNCAAYTSMETWYNRGERNTWLIGDDGYFIEPWLMTPLKHEAVGTPNFRYNEALCKARCTVERLFGVMKSEFGCISSGNTLLYTPEMVGKIVNACCILHNIRIEDRVENIDINPSEVEAQVQANAAHAAHDEDNNIVHLSRRAQGQRVQRRLIEQHFT